MATCAEVHTSTDRHPDRVGLIVDAKPSCLCERDSMSANSPGVVNDYEVIIRLVCAPMHVHSKRPELKSSFFSHVFTKGASAQRLDHATDTELVTTIDTLITSADDRLWLGYVQCRAKDIRQINVGEKSGQLFCVYDAALPPQNVPDTEPTEPENPAHAEIHASRRIPEADEIQYRVELAKAFNASGIRPRRTLRGGVVWASLREDLKDRKLPDQWAMLD